MIFVTVGTTDFDGLVRHVDTLAPRLGEEVICQVGNGAWVPRNCQYFRFAATLAEYLHAARLVVSHGGQGTILDVVRLGKPLVGVSNPDRRDHHQDDILRRFEEDKHLVWCRSLPDLEAAIQRAGSLFLAPYEEPTCRIQTLIEEYLATAVGGRGSHGR